ncbi:MAG: ATP-binding protein [Myxococcota bacterium]
MATPTAVFIVDGAGTLVATNEAGRVLSGYGAAALAGLPLERLLTPDRAQLLTQAGESLSVEVHVAPLVPAGSIVSVRPRRVAATTQIPFELLVEGSGEEVYLARRDGSLAYVNEAAARSVGYSRDELLAMGVGGIDREFGPRFAAHLDSLRQAEGPPFETTHHTKDGRQLIKELKSVYLSLDGEEYVCGFARDITARKKAEARLQLVTRLHAVLSGINKAVVRQSSRQALFEEVCRVVVDEGQFRMAWVGLLGDDGRVRPVASAGHVAGYLDDVFIDLRSKGPTGTAIREGLLDVCPDIAGEARMAPWRERALARGYRASASVPLRLRGRPIAALNLYAAETGLLTGEDRELLRDIGADVSYALDAMAAEEERERLEGQLRQAHKLESIGQLAGGVAHDFNNMLTVILSNVSLGLDAASSPEEMREALAEIRDAAERSAELTRQLLAFARRQPVKPRALDLNVELEASLKLLRRLIGEQLVLHFRPGRELWPVFADAGQLSQVLANLVVNARDAIHGPGQITLETTNVPSAELRGTPLDGDCVALRVTDDGEGLSPEVREHLFEPFFTTRGPGRGTGLGLATVYGIVKQHRGHVEVASEQGKGTTFTVLLPRHIEAVPLAAEPKAGAPSRALARARVLLVEDEPAVLAITRTLLTRFGYDVMAVGRPEAALALDDVTRFDVLLTDVVMPGMNGRELAEALQKRHPPLRTLFMSGYTADLLPRELEVTRVLAKPFTPDALAEALARLVAPD